MATQASDTSGKTRARGSADELAVIAQRAQAFTNASGTAIALSEGSMDELTCRARSGATAPEVGIPLRVEGSFTGLCIHSGKELRCDDAETDTRVDTASLRSLGIRSLVVTPVREDNRVVGVLMVFAPTPHAFTITHVAVLKTMADQISSLLQRARKTKKEEGILPEPSRPISPAPVAVAKPGPALPGPVVIKPSPTPPRPAAFPVVSRVEPFKTAPIAENVATAVAPARAVSPARAVAPAKPAKREERRESRAQQRANLGTLDSLVGEARRANNNLMIGIAAVVVIAAGGIFAYRSMIRSKSVPPAPGIHERAGTEITSGAANGQPADGLGAPAAQPGTSGATFNAPGAVIPAPAPVKSSPGSLAFDNRRAERAERLVIPNTPPGKPSPEEVVVATTPSKIASNGGDAAMPDITPVFNTPGTSSTAGTLNSLTNPGATSTPSMITQSSLEPVQVLKRVKPIYPSIAQARRLSGTVMVQATVTVDGRATKLVFVSGPPVFRDAAFEAVKQWQFKPAKLNGRPIEQTELIHMSFTPN